MSLIRIEHLRKEYPEATPLKDINAEINQGDVIAIIGPSGTGKSTLLYCLNQLEEPTSGKVYLDDQEITDPKCDINQIRRKMGMVFQSFNLFDNKTVLENVISAPIDLLKMPKEQAVQEGKELLRKVGLEGRENHFPEELSGGQKQRVAIARAIAMKPEILLLDEPTSALDPTLVNEVLSVVRNLVAEGMTMLIVTHEMRFAREVSNRVFYLDEGLIYEEGTPEQIFNHPQKEKTRAFIKQLKTISLDISPSATDFAGIVQQLEEYGRKTMLEPARVRRMTLVIEELVTQVIGHLRERDQMKSSMGSPEEIPAHLYVERSEIEDNVTVEIRYGGEPFDPLTEGDELSLIIVKHLTSELNCQLKEEDGKPVNQVTAVLQ